jgi:hypothetical protein
MKYLLIITMLFMACTKQKEVTPAKEMRQITITCYCKSGNFKLSHRRYYNPVDTIITATSYTTTTTMYIADNQANYIFSMKNILKTNNDSMYFKVNDFEKNIVFSGGFADLSCQPNR